MGFWHIVAGVYGAGQIETVITTHGGWIANETNRAWIAALTTRTWIVQSGGC